MQDERVLPVDGSLFEALFRLRAPDAALAQKLEALGVPLNSPARHRADQWRAALELYRLHLFPDDLQADGSRKLGRALAEAYGATIPGRLLLIALPMLSPLQWLRRWPRFIRMGRTDVVIDVTEVDANTVVITSLDPVNVPMEINLGLLDFVFEKMGHAVQFEQRALPTGEVSVTCRW